MQHYESGKRVTIERRLFTGYLPLCGQGIDVGAGRARPASGWWWEDPELLAVYEMQCRPWDIADGDAHTLPGVEESSYAWLHASHILEHLEDPERALARWVDVVRPGGVLLLSVPHRQLYEQRRTLPSRWNPGGHLRYYLPYAGERPDTVGFWYWLGGLEEALGFDITRFSTGDWGHTNTGTGEHPNGEYCIDALLRRRRE